MTRFDHIVCAVAQGLLAQEGQGDNGSFQTQKAFVDAVVDLAEAIEARLVEREKAAAEARRQRAQQGPTAFDMGEAP